MDTLTNSMLQFGVDVANPNEAAQESARFINVLAASARVGAAEIPQVGDAVLVAGVAAKKAKVSFEETNAAIQVLAAGGKVGAEAGTALRNVLGKIAGEEVIPNEALKKLKSLGVDMNKVSNTAIPLSERLTELGKASKDATAFAQVFGTENAAAASILADGAATIKDWTAQVTGTKDAAEQAAKNMATFAEFSSRVGASLQKIGINIYQAIIPVINNVIGLVQRIIEKVAPVFSEIGGQLVSTFKNAYEALKPVLTVIAGVIGGVVLIAITNSVTILKTAATVVSEFVSKLKNTLTPIFNNITKLFGETGAAALSLDDIFDAFGKTLSFFADLAGEVGSLVAEVLVTPFQILYGVVNNVVEFFVKLFTSTRDVKNESKSLGEETKKTTGFFQKLGEIILRIPEFIAGLKGAFGALKQVFFDLGEAISNVFENGISGTIENILNIFKGAGSKIGEGAAKAISDKVFSKLEKDFADLSVKVPELELTDALKSIDDFGKDAEKKFKEQKITSEQFTQIGKQLDELRKKTTLAASLQKKANDEQAGAKKKEVVDEKELEKLQKARFEAAKNEIEDLKQSNKARFETLKREIEIKEAQTGIKASKEEQAKLAALGIKNGKDELELAQKLFKAVGAGADVKINANIGENKRAAKKIVNDIEAEIGKSEIDLAKLTGKIAIPKDFKAELEKLVSDFESQQINIEFIARISKTKPQKDLDELINNLEGEKFFLQAELDGITDENKRKIINDTIAKIDAEIAKAKLSFTGKLDLSVGFNEAKKQVDMFIEDLDKQKQSIELAIKGKTDPKEIKELEDLLKVISKKRLDAEKDFNKLTAELGEKAFQARLSLIDDEEEKKRILKIRALQKERDEAINNEFLTQEEKLKIVKKYGEEINKLNEGNSFDLAQFTSNSFAKIAEGLTEVSKGATDEQKKNYEDAKKSLDEVNAKHKERIDNINKEIASLVKGNEKGTASYNKIAEKVAQLEEDKKNAVLEANKEIEEANKKLQENSIETSDLIKNNLAESFKKLRETATGELSNLGKKIGETFAKLKEDNAGNITNLEEVTTSVMSTLTQSVGVAVAAIGAGFGELIAKGNATFGDFAKLAASTVLDTVQVAVNAYAAQIFAVNAAALPFGLGVPGALALIAGVNALLAVAKSGLSGIGAETGVVGINGNYNKKKGKTDTIPLWVAPNESIINAKQSLKYKGILEAINTGSNVSGAIINNLPQSELKMLQKYMSGNVLSGEIRKDVVSNVNKIFTSNSYDNSTENRFNRNSTLNKVHEQMQYYYDNKSYSNLYRSLVENKYHNLVQHFTSPEKNIYTVQENIRPKENNNELRYLADKLDNLKIVLERNEIIDITGELKGNGRDFNAMFNKELRRKSRRF